MTPPRRAKLVLLMLTAAIVGLGVWHGEAVWWWVMTKRDPCQNGSDGHEMRGWETVPRWEFLGTHRSAELWFAETGFKASKGEWETADRLAGFRITVWNPDGSVKMQLKGLPRRDKKASPPWWWGVTDQTEPSIPAWMKDDEKWQAALDAER